MARVRVPLSRRRALALAAAPFLASGVARAADEWPHKPVRYINVFPPGGPTDTLSRIVCAELSELTGVSVMTIHRDIAELAGRWRDAGYIPPNSDTNAVAATMFTLMHGLIVMHHLVDDVPSDALRNGLSLLGAAVVGPYTLPPRPPQEAKP